MTTKCVFPAVAMLFALALVPEAHAQAINLGGGGSGQPIEIIARDGIEWNRDAKQYIARGDARASQQGTTVEADTLTAYYREGANARTEIYRYQAEGNVRIFTPTHRAVGDRAIFDIDTGVLVLTGKGLKLTTPGEVVTARDALEYWDRRQVAVARGDALVLTQDGRRMKGDLLTAHFIEGAARPQPSAGGARPQATAPRPQASPPPRNVPAVAPGAGPQTGSQRLQRVEAFGDVHVSTETDIAIGDRGVYNADTGIVVLAGNVKITRGRNQLNGDYAEVNTNTGISRLLSDSQQVRGLFVPENQKDGTAPVPGRRTQ
jgi:lipopolysaccharide export system protein LptA